VERYDEREVFEILTFKGKSAKFYSFIKFSQPKKKTTLMELS